MAAYHVVLVHFPIALLDDGDARHTVACRLERTRRNSNRSRARSAPISRSSVRARCRRGRPNGVAVGRNLNFPNGTQSHSARSLDCSLLDAHAGHSVASRRGHLGWPRSLGDGGVGCSWQRPSRCHRNSGRPSGRYLHGPISSIARVWLGGTSHVLRSEYDTRCSCGGNGRVARNRMAGFETYR